MRCGRAATFSAMRAELTFKARVERFWEWYAQVAARFYKTLGEDNARDVMAETEEKVDALFPGFAWVYGPGEAGPCELDRRGHSERRTACGRDSVNRAFGFHRQPRRR